MRINEAGTVRRAGNKIRLTYPGDIFHRFVKDFFDGRMKENFIIKYLKHQSFQPGVLGLFFNPLFFARNSLFRNIRKFSTRLNGKLLDFGCGRKPYENLFHVSEYTGVDLRDSGHDHRNSKADVYYNGRNLPFSDETFDALFCSEVLEHIFNPDEILPEINRVMKKGAPALITVPFCWNEHEMPFDYARYSSAGIRNLLERHGFDVVEIKKCGNFARVNVQLLSLYFFELFRKWGKPGYVLSMLFIIPVNILGTFLLIFLPVNKTMYFTNLIYAKKNEQQAVSVQDLTQAT